MSERAQLNFTTGEIEDISRLAQAQREIKDIADELYQAKTSKKETRRDYARRLNLVASSLKTVEMRMGGELE